MKRIAFFAYGVACYAMFLGVFLYAIAFLGNFGLANSIDAAPRTHVGWALLIDVALLGLFAVQHSLMARPTFKRWWTKWVPQPIERSTYVLASNAALLALFLCWQPIGGQIWNLEHPAARGVMYGVFAGGWLTILATTFLINHFDLFGMRQVWLYLRGKPYTPLQFTTPGPYRLVRHPLYVGWLMTFWASPAMTVAHLVFALATTAYILVAIQLEERNLAEFHGEAYRQYRRRVPMLLPQIPFPTVRQRTKV
ncbi:MAG: isoprenylcysteine carboxylmethyltransferase family protein [Pirellulaceae bacterium]